MGRPVDIEDFARRVERLCEFLLAQIKAGHRDGSADLQVIENLQEDAAEIQSASMIIGPEIFTGLSDFMHGIPPKEETKEP
jgi:hypothetical protein